VFAFGQLAQKLCLHSAAEKMTECGQYLRFDGDSFAGLQRVLQSG